MGDDHCVTSITTLSHERVTRGTTSTTRRRRRRGRRRRRDRRVAGPTTRATPAGSTLRASRRGSRVETAREEVAALLGRPSPIGRLHQRGHRGDRAACWGAAERGRPPGRWPRSSTRRSGWARRRSATPPWSASTASGRIDPDELLAAVRPDTALVTCSGATTRSATRAAGRRGGGRRCRERGVLVHVDAAPGRRARRRSTSTSSAPTCCPSPPTSSAARRRRRAARATRAADPPAAGRAATRSGPGVAGIEPVRHARRLRRRGRDARARAAPSGRAPSSAASPSGSSLPSRSVDGVRVYGDPVDRLPHLVCLGVDGVEPQAVLLGLDRAGRGRPLRVGVLQSRRSSRRRCSRRWAWTPTTACACRSAGAPPMTTSTPRSTALPGILQHLRSLAG